MQCYRTIVQNKITEHGVIHCSSVLWCWLGGRKGIRPVKKLEWWGAGVVICLERGADLHIAQLIPLSLALVKSRLVLPFWYLLTWIVPEKRPLNVCCCCCCVCGWQCTAVFVGVVGCRLVAGTLRVSDNWPGGCILRVAMPADAARPAVTDTTAVGKLWQRSGAQTQVSQQTRVRCTFCSLFYCCCVSKPCHLLPHLNPVCFYLSDTGLPRLSWKRGH